MVVQLPVHVTSEIEVGKVASVALESTLVTLHRLDERHVRLFGVSRGKTTAVVSRTDGTRLTLLIEVTE